MGELHVDLGVRLVAAGGHVKIMDRQRLGEAGGALERDRHVAGVVLFAEAVARDVGEGLLRDDGDAVPAFLSVQRDVAIADPLELRARETLVGALGLLQAQDVRLMPREKARDLREAQAHRVDVPGGDGEWHRD